MTSVRGNTLLNWGMQALAPGDAHAPPGAGRSDEEVEAVEGARPERRCGPRSGANGAVAPRVHCFLCAHHCRIAPGNAGSCGVRENRDGVLYTLVYGCPVSTAVDPIEKKPLFHFLPGSRPSRWPRWAATSPATFCQNAEISQMPRDQGTIIGQAALARARWSKRRCETGCLSISYTYTEPTIFYEYARDCARSGREAAGSRTSSSPTAT